MCETVIEFSILSGQKIRSRIFKILYRAVNKENNKGAGLEAHNQ